MHTQTEETLYLSSIFVFYSIDLSIDLIFPSSLKHCLFFFFFYTDATSHFSNSSSILPGLRGCVTDDDVAMHLIKHTEDFEKYLHYMVGQAQAEACANDKATQQYFKVLTKLFSIYTVDTLLHLSDVVYLFNMLLITFQELAETGKPDTPVMDVLTFLQRPVERIQTYQALLKVSIQFH